MLQTQFNDTTSNSTLLAVSLELAKNSWKVAFQDGRRARPSLHAISDLQPLARLEALLALIHGMLLKWKLPESTRVVLCYECGQDGFWITRALADRGYEALAVDAASIEVSRQSKRAKTDRLDAIKLVTRLMSWLHGDQGCMRVVHVPKLRDEGLRQLARERGELQKECQQHRDRMRKLLRTEGCWDNVQGNFAQRLKDCDVTTYDGQPLQPLLRRRLEQECLRLAQVEAQFAKLESDFLELLPEDVRGRVRQLSQLKGIGLVSAERLVLELFWRDFHNRREVGACVGLVPQPFDSGESHVDQGISKQGNRRVRALLIEIAWFWLRYQGNSALAQWFIKRTSGSGPNKRIRRIAIVAVARKLTIALWRYLTAGEIPQGAELGAC
jgi:transposase